MTYKLNTDAMLERKVYIKTFGCQMNEYDSLLILEQVEQYGYTETEDMKEADLILFNTCAIRGLSEHKALSELGATRKLKAKKPSTLIGIVGCVAQKLGQEIARKYRFVDFVLGTKQMYKFSDILSKAVYDNPIVKTDLDANLEGYATKKSKGVTACITIVRGCQVYCSYCIVPYVRGHYDSRTVDDIELEARELVTNGAKEITLLGQNVNAYGIDIETNLETLLERLDKIDGLKRLRYVTSHPKNITKQFIKTLAGLDKVTEHINIPFQSGSNNVLKSMNRKYTIEEYIDKINLIREFIPNIALSADVIIGYPGESEKDFEQTLNIMEKLRFDSIYSFKYSPREGTTAYKRLEDDVSKKDQFLF